MVLTEQHLIRFHEILDEDEIITQTSDPTLYSTETQCWSAQHDCHPQLILRPKSITALQTLLPYLYDAPVEFAVRSGGIGNASARDVVLSMRAFDQVNFDPDTEILTVGAGMLWGEVEKELQKVAEGYAVLCARVPYVGVAGSILHGGFSWLSHEYGLMSDPHNLLDAQVILSDGRVLWANEEGESALLWALRGGGGNFGVVTAFKLRARKYPQRILGGTIIFPESSLEAVSRGVSAFTETITDPKVSMHVYFLEPRNPFFPFPAGVGLMIFDANGEEHGRGKDGFKWAFDIEGAIDMTKEMTLFEVHDATAYSSISKGATDSWLCQVLITVIDPEFLVRAFKWYKRVLDTNEDFGSGSFVLLELTQKAALTSSGSPGATAWPHQFHYHTLGLGTGYRPGSLCTEEQALGLLRQGLEEITNEPIKEKELEFFPNFEGNFTDSSKTFGENYKKLRKLKSLYDPKCRFKGLLPIEPWD
ncbi:hypothetical protein OCU04_012695 [Sclerotinia nivalis]|uniref:FAD-binding PCMH-type domain-containing protein n=1 Tax=Sclerotinia nivalis TaxID=352851 RepID=A0A9X0A9A1_9HELO|nr:hypothetical protein OCU04_012695 [Sclerotinia nivalis]